MSQLSQDVGMGGLSQVSGFSMNMLDTEEPLSQVSIVCLVHGGQVPLRE